MVMTATFDYRLSVSRPPTVNKAAGFSFPGSKGVCQFNSVTNGHHALKANLEGLERQYLTLVEFVTLLFSVVEFFLDGDLLASTGTSSSGGTSWVNSSKG